MINPLAIATRGRIAVSSVRVLTFATLGWIIIAIIPPPTPPSNEIALGSSAGAVGPSVLFWDKKRILNDDEEIYLMLKIFVENL